jgi:hypothetical protein
MALEIKTLKAGKGSELKRIVYKITTFKKKMIQAVFYSK